MSDTNYVWERRSDGTFAVRNLPIFELGEHRGFRYDEAWARRALKTFATLKSRHGYLPPVILGHTSEDCDEKPAVGFLDRLRLIGSKIVADLVGLSKEVFHDIRAGRWPYRSVEVFDRAAQITALALLGGTPPAMKTTPLHFAEDGAAAVWIEGERLPRFAPEKPDDGGTMEDTNRDEAKRFSEEEVTTLIEAARAEERAKSDETLRTTRQRLEQLESEAEKTRRRAFQSDLRQLGYSPAIVDAPEMTALVEELSRRAEPVRFADEDLPAIAVFRRVLGFIAERVQQGSAFVQTGEVARTGRPHQFGEDGNGDGAEDNIALRFGDRVDPDSMHRYVRARDLAKAEGIPFRDALVRVIEGDAA